MLVKDCMTRHPVMVPPEMPVAEAQQIMMENKVRHLPVVSDGKRLVGLVTEQRLMLKPDAMASLDLWEITRYISTLTVKKVMLKVKANEVVTVETDVTVEKAAEMMNTYKIDCLPVVAEGVVVGIISESDLLQALQEMLGLPSNGIRVTMRMPNKKGQFGVLTSAVAEHGLGIMGIGSFPTSRNPGYYDMVLKIPNATLAEVKQALGNIPEQEIVDIRETE